ncbi:MAG: hypothetical protein ACR2M9_01675 [Cyanophyceae cyanobacterium]
MSEQEIPKVKEYPCHHPDCDKVYKTVTGRWKHTKTFHPELQRKKPPTEEEIEAAKAAKAEAKPEVKQECCENCNKLKEVIHLLLSAKGL